MAQPGMLREQCCLEQKYKRKMVKCGAREVSEGRSWKYPVVLVSRGNWEEEGN